MKKLYGFSSHCGGRSRLQRNYTSSFFNFTGIVEGQVTRFGRIVMKVVLTSLIEGVVFTLNMSETLSGENMSGAASALMNGYQVDSDYTWLSARE